MKVAFYKGTQKGFQGLVNRLVRWWTHGSYSHCELVFEYGQCASSSLMDNGVRIANLNVCTPNWDCIEVEGDIPAAWDWFEQHKGQPYDLLGDFGFIWRPLAGSRRKWFCSEAVAAALGFPQPWRFDPNTLYAILTRKRSSNGR